jgi:arabinose-5-phosphate isomerase
MAIDYSKIACDVLDTELEAIKSLSEVFKDKLGFCEAVKLLSESKGRVIISGVGKSGIIAKKIAATFSSIGKPSYFLHAAEASHGDLGVIGDNDVVIVISNSGESLEIFGVIDFCKKLMVPIIAIVGKPQSTLARSAKIVICMPEFKEVSHIVMPTTSTTLVSIIGDALAACLVESSNITFEEYKSYHPGGKIGKNLIKVKDIMRKGEDLPLATKEMLMSEALVVMTAGAMGCLVVVNNNDEVEGMITDGDLRRNMSNDLLSIKVHQVMNVNPRVVGLEEWAIDALKFMNKIKITNLLVIDNGKLQGVVHLHDCLRLGLE